MSLKKISIYVSGITTLIFVAFTIYKSLSGEKIGFSDIVSIIIILPMFISAITWGNKNEDNGILEKEELGKKITEESCKISYFLLTVFILVAFTVDNIISGNINILLSILAGLSMVTLPLIEFIISKKYL